MKRLPVAVLVIAALLVAISAVAAALGFGDGTILFLSVGSAALRVVAMVTRTQFMYAFHHYYAAACAVSVVINMVLYLVPAAPALLVLRHKPVASSGVAAIWCAFYVACLFVLFPVTRS